MTMEIKNSETYRSSLEAEIVRHATRSVDLIIVEDIAEWARTRKGNAVGNPPAMAVTDGETGRWGILLRRSIEEDWVSSILARIEFGGFDGAQSLLDSPEVFLRPLVLHELAHLENSWGQELEADCDAWAFEKLGIDAN
jgi:hypothetical protein